MPEITHAFDETKRLKAKNRQLAEQNENLDAWLKESDLRMKAQIEETRSLRADRNRLISEVDVTQGQLEAARKILAMSEAEIERLKAKLTAAEKDGGDLRRKLDEAGAANRAAFQTLLGVIKTRPLALTGLAQIAELAAERIRWLEQEHKDANADNAALYEALTDVEWGGGAIWRPLCPECGNWPNASHRPDCKLFRALSTVRDYRERTTNNQQPQGEQPMPKIMEITEEVDSQTTSGKPLLIAEWDNKALAAQVDLEAEMKRRLDRILGRAPDTPESLKIDRGAPQSPKTTPNPPDTVGRRTAPPDADCPITPETAPVGARILIRQRFWLGTLLTEATVLEWAPSGQAVKLRWPSGIEAWESELLNSKLLDGARLFERLPPSSSFGIGSADAAQIAEMLAQLTEAGVERLRTACSIEREIEQMNERAKVRQTEVNEIMARRNAALDALLEGKPGAAATLDRLDEVAEKRQGKGDEEC